MTENPPRQPVLAVVEDLMSASRIEGIARAHGVPCRRVRKPEELDAALAGDPPGTLFVDLALRGMDPIEVIRKVRAQPAWQAVPLVAFGSHVEVGKLRAAREAGASEALARSEFTDRLPELVRR